MNKDPFENPLKNFLFIDQLKIMGYGESDTSGCWIKFQLTPELLEIIRGRKGEMVEVAARLIDNSGEYIPPDKARSKIVEKIVEPLADHLETIKVPDVDDILKMTDDSLTKGPGPHGKFWYQLIRQGIFNAPPVLEVIGSDEKFQDWIRIQQSCLSKEQDWDTDAGEGRNEVAHIRRISEGAGTAIKPPYFAVPLTHAEHALQHQSGEVVALNLYGPQKKGADPGSWNEDEAANWFEKKARYYRTEWATKTLALKLGYESRTECPPEDVLGWVDIWKLDRFFPKQRE